MDTSIVALDDLVERLVEAGDGLLNVVCIYRDGDMFDEVYSWAELASEWQAMKGGKFDDLESEEE